MHAAHCCVQVLSRLEASGTRVMMATPSTAPCRDMRSADSQKRVLGRAMTENSLMVIQCHNLHQASTGNLADACAAAAAAAREYADTACAGHTCLTDWQALQYMAFTSESISPAMGVLILLQ